MLILLHSVCLVCQQIHPSVAAIVFFWRTVYTRPPRSSKCKYTTQNGATAPSFFSGGEKINIRTYRCDLSMAPRSAGDWVLTAGVGWARSLPYRAVRRRRRRRRRAAQAMSLHRKAIRRLPSEFFGLMMTMSTVWCCFRLFARQDGVGDAWNEAFLGRPGDIKAPYWDWSVFGLSQCALWIDGARWLICWWCACKENIRPMCGRHLCLPLL